MYRGELYHHGIKGMKWGTRRYQNADGTLTNAGKKRYERDARENNWEIGQDGVARSRGRKNKGEEHHADANKWVKEDLERTRRLTDSSKQFTNESRNLNNAIGRAKNRRIQKMDLSNMTDKEMRDQINRAMLERQYDDMFNPKKVSNGRDHVNDTLEIVGSSLGIASSALAIALAIKELKG